MPIHLWKNIKQEDRDKIRPILKEFETDLNVTTGGETEGSLDKARRELKTTLKEIGNDADAMYKYFFGDS